MTCQHSNPQCRAPTRIGRLAALLIKLVTTCLMAALLVALVSLYQHYVHPPPEDATTWSNRPTIEQIQRLAHLVTTRVTVSDVLTGEGDGVRGIWLIKGDALLSVDLSDVQVEVIDRPKQRAVIVLRAPRVLSARVDHQRSLTWDIQRTTWVPWRGDKDQLRDQAYYHAQRLVEYAASRPERIAEAKLHAAHALAETYHPLGWTVEVRWR